MQSYMETNKFAWYFFRASSSFEVSRIVEKKMAWCCCFVSQTREGEGDEDDKHEGEAGHYNESDDDDDGECPHSRRAISCL